MANNKSFLSLDFGAGTMKAAEFEVTEGGALQLNHFALVPLGSSGGQEAAREATIVQATRELVSSRGIQSKEANICAPGSSVFSKFVKLPPVDTSKVTQIIQYEAQQNVPFPLEEVVWDFQILGTAASGELEVLLVAIKTDIVEGLFRTASNAGLRLQLVDVSPAALCNAFRYNYGELDGCTMLLDIGARSSNLLFFEKGKVYSRSINIGANSITQEFATESRLGFDDAEKIKAEKGFVSLGGAYEEPEDPQAAAISKIARQVMTRLHIQVNQTIQFFRNNQGGTAPIRLFLAGGASIMPYTAQFFADKLNLPVEYFNPFRNVQLGPGINPQELERVAHCFGEVVGLGLRNLAHCPVELNLMPKSSIQKQQFNRKRPYIVATVFCLVAVLLAYGYVFNKIVAAKKSQLERFDNDLRPWQANEAQLMKAQAELKKSKEEAAEFTARLAERSTWPDILTELRRAMLQTERATAKTGVDTGVWIESMVMQTSDIPPPQEGEAPAEAEPAEPSLPVGRLALGVASATTNELAFIKLTMRAVSLRAVSPSANTELMYAFTKELQAKDLQLRELKKRLNGGKEEEDPPAADPAAADPAAADPAAADPAAADPPPADEAKPAPDAAQAALEKQISELKPTVIFDGPGTQLSGLVPTTDETAFTFTFGVTLKLKNPIKL